MMSCPVQDILKYRIVCSPHTKQHRRGSGCGQVGYRSEIQREKAIDLDLRIFLIILLHLIITFAVLRDRLFRVVSDHFPRVFSHS